MKKKKEIVKKSSSIFQILLKQYFKTTKDFKAARKNLLEKNDEYIKLINENISDGQKPYYFAITETLLYFFEKNSIIYFNNIFYSLKKEKEGILMEKEPMSIYKDCIMLFIVLFSLIISIIFSGSLNLASSSSNILINI